MLELNKILRADRAARSQSQAAPPSLAAEVTPPPATRLTVAAEHCQTEVAEIANPTPQVCHCYH